MSALPPDAVVIRGGLMAELTYVREQAEDDNGRLSVWAGVRTDGETMDGLLRRLCEEAKVPNKKIRLSRVAELEAAGFSFQHDPPPDCHYNVSLGTVTDDTLQTFVQSFDAAITKPT